jgi:hypothetical protein|tara:strand:- start:421 stop:582 length:162 start_codon:yes stop_codon:yes gene_type:complete
MLSKIKNYIKYNIGIPIGLDNIAENISWDLMKNQRLKHITIKRHETKCLQDSN